MDVAFDTASTAAADVLRRLHDALDTRFVSLDVAPRTCGPSPSGLDVRFSAGEVDDVNIARFSGTPVSAYRTPRHIHRSPRDEYIVALHLSGPARLAQDGRRAVLHPGDIAVLDSDQPYAIELGGAEPFEHVAIRVPRGRFTAGRPLPVGVTGVGLAATSDAGRLLSPYFRTLTAPDWKATVLTSRFLDSGLSLLAAVLEESASDRTPRTSEHLHRIQREARRQLTDPALSPATVAAACHMSIRQLHRLFAEDGTTFGTWLRNERLQHCYADLTDPALLHLPVADIAQRWGYRSPAHFSRAFGDRYGTTPRNVRRRAGTRRPPAFDLVRNVRN
ncbi:helix-turn-helix domain-containing protein [Pseudonocardia sp. CA-142604]|uniref:helix-turn-helix domain-containing protein n=1 Tax=Pseudonocardia sp. CA-142604 TaxID=3240024 RepID=UPI003D8F83A0